MKPLRSYNGFSGAQRARAHLWTLGAVNRGERFPPCKCDACGQKRGVIQFHAEDYREPFGAHVARYALCFSCHVVWHCRHRAPAQVARYIRMIRDGWRADPVLVVRPNLIDRAFLQRAGIAWPMRRAGIKGAGEVFGRMSREAAQFTGRDWCAEHRA